MILTQAQCIKRGYFKKPIVAVSRAALPLPKGRDWLFIASPDLGGERYLASDILAACCAHFGVSASDIVSHKRSKREYTVRHVFCYLARELTKLSIERIGRIIDRDHTTVLNSIKVASRSPEIMEAVNQIKAGLVRVGL